jgi:hypothetical protein
MTDQLVAEDRGRVNVRHRYLGNNEYVGDIVDVASFPAASGDAFGRLRVSNPQALFSGKGTQDAQPLLFDDVETAGSGTTSVYTATTASVAIGVTADTAGTRVRQSKRRMIYQPGKSQLAFFTFTMGEFSTGITRSVGLFDDDNGVFLQQRDDDEVGLVIRNDTTDFTVLQADWNIDNFDATDVSDTTLDLTKSQIFFIDYEWLGVGTVRCGFVIDGQLFYAHAFHHANREIGVYMATPNLPVRYSIANDGDGTAADTFETICSAVISEGGQDFAGISRAADRSATALVTLDDADLYPVISIRLKAASLGSLVRACNMSVFTTSTAVFRWALLLNPTVAGTALSFSSVANSPVEADAASTNATKVSGGTLLASGYGESTVQDAITAIGTSDIALGSLVDGTSDIVVLAVQRLTGATETFYGTLGWTEEV